MNNEAMNLHEYAEPVTLLLRSSALLCQVLILIYSGSRNWISSPLPCALCLCGGRLLKIYSPQRRREHGGGHRETEI